MATIVLIPGLLGAGIGSLIFLGLNSLTGYGTFSLAIPNLPPFGHLDVAQFGWALAIGAAAASSAPGSSGRPCSCARTWSGGWCCSRRWRAW